MSKYKAFWMQKAIEQAKLGKTPFGAIIVNENEKYIAAFNTTKADGPTAHAEMNVIRKLKELQFESAKNLSLYSTVEPCPMCMSAIVWAGIGEVVYGASITDANQFGKQIDINCAEVVSKAWCPIQLQAGVEREQCVALFKS